MSDFALQLIAENKRTKDTTLDLSFCQDLVQLPPEIKECVWLNEFILDFDSKVSDLSPLSGLKNLQRLNVFSSSVSDLSPVRELKNLQRLNVASTDVSDLSPLRELKNLQRLDIYYTKVTDLSPIVPLIKNGIRLEVAGCPLTTPPLEIALQGNQAILQYFAGHNKEGAQNLYEADLRPRFHSPAPKYLLVLEGGGMNCLGQLAILEALESRLQRQTGNSDHWLCDTFDLVCGSDLAAYIAVEIASGLPVSRILRVVQGDILPHVNPSSGQAGEMLAGFKYIFEKQFSNKTFGDYDWKSGICIALRRANTGALVAFLNHPDHRDYPEYKQFSVLEAVLQAITPFQNILDPQKDEKRLVSAGTGLFHHPELLLFHVATHPDFPFQWRMGDDNLHILSIGTGPIPDEASVIKKRTAEGLDLDLLSRKSVGDYIASQAQAHQERLARWLFDGEPLSSPTLHSQPWFPLGFRPAQVTRLSLGELSPRDLADYESLRARAARTLESVDISVLMPAVPA